MLQCKAPGSAQVTWKSFEVLLAGALAQVRPQPLPQVPAHFAPSSAQESLWREACCCHHQCAQLTSSGRSAERLGRKQRDHSSSGSACSSPRKAYPASAWGRPTPLSQNPSGLQPRLLSTCLSCENRASVSALQDSTWQTRLARIACICLQAYLRVPATQEGRQDAQGPGSSHHRCSRSAQTEFHAPHLRCGSPRKGGRVERPPVRTLRQGQRKVSGWECYEGWHRRARMWSCTVSGRSLPPSLVRAPPGLAEPPRARQAWRRRRSCGPRSPRWRASSASSAGTAPPT
jgi:hypothetical protein